MFQTKVVEGIKTHLLCSLTFFLIVPFMRFFIIISIQPLG